MFKYKTEIYLFSNDSRIQLFSLNSSCNELPSLISLKTNVIFNSMVYIYSLNLKQNISATTILWLNVSIMKIILEKMKTKSMNECQLRNAIHSNYNAKKNVREAFSFEFITSVNTHLTNVFIYRDKREESLFHLPEMTFISYLCFWEDHVMWIGISIWVEGKRIKDCIARKTSRFLIWFQIQRILFLLICIHFLWYKHMKLSVNISHMNIHSHLIYSLIVFPSIKYEIRSTFPVDINYSIETWKERRIMLDENLNKILKIDCWIELTIKLNLWGILWFQGIFQMGRIFFFQADSNGEQSEQKTTFDMKPMLKSKHTILEIL